MQAIQWFFSQWWGILITVLVCLALVIVLYRPLFKRVFDILLSGLALILLSPVYLVLTILVGKKLGKPVMFKQYRPGKKNKIFRLHKYRTMTEERDEAGNLLPDDLRMTTFGRKLRSTSLDELPEIWDIFRGKMSIVGPRPQLVRDLVFMDETVRMRHRVRPGLTGLAQVSGRNNLGWDERFAFDLKYIRHINIFSDIAILCKTVVKIFAKADIATDGMETSEDYGDYLLRLGRITQEAYDAGQAEAKEKIDACKRI